MNCYNCGCNLSEKDFCTGCGIDVMKYKKIVECSNLLFNEGLRKANVRDLSGAILSLHQSLKFNRNNIQARNLLGLVYFEIGEVVAALSEWIISKNIRGEKNVADDYIKAVQNNSVRLETINQTIKKYNQALIYCSQDSSDLAVIQLKKVLSLNPKFIRAHQLLALVYIKTEEWEKAKRELERCQKIDLNNTRTLNYLKEVMKAITTIDENVVHKKTNKSNNKSNNKSKDQPYQYQSGNEIIIQPGNIKEPSKLTGLVSVASGAIIGLILAWFLIMPARVQKAETELLASNKEISEELDLKTASLVELNQEITTLEDKNKKIANELADYVGNDGKLKVNDSLLMAADSYLNDAAEIDVIAKHLELINQEFLDDGASKAFIQLYDNLIDKSGAKIAEDYYTTGITAMRQEDFTNAIENIEKAWIFNKKDGNILYNLANAYKGSGDTENATATYKKVIALFPNTDIANKSRQTLELMENQ